MPRTEKQFEEIRATKKALILDAALQVFARDGYHNASINKISKQAGISKGLMYNYFNSKEELLEILIGELFDKELEVVYSLLEKPFNEESFTALIKLGTKILKQNPKQWQLYFSMATQAEVKEILEKRFTPERIQFSQNIISYFENKGCDNPIMEALYFSMVMSGFKLSYIMNPEAFPIDEMEERLIQQFVK